METLSQPVQQAVEVYTKGVKAWIRDEVDNEEAWVSATVLSKEVTDTGVKIVFQNDEDESRVSLNERKAYIYEYT